MSPASPRNDVEDLPSESRYGRVLEAALIATGLVLVVGLRSFEPFWRVGPGLIVLGALSAVAYLAGRAVRVREPGRGLLHALLVTLVVSQPILLALWALDLSASRLVLAAELTVLFLAIAVAGPPPGRWRLVAAAGFAGVSALPVLAALVSEPAAPIHAGPERAYVFTSYHDLALTTHQLVPEEVQDGGALAPLPDGRLLLMSGSGIGRLVEVSPDGTDVRATPIELGLPLNVNAYLEAGLRLPEFYRAFDVLYHEGRLYVTHLYWEPERDCYTLRLLESEFDGRQVVGPWKTRFETRPCVPIPHVYNTSGGRLALDDDGNLLMTVGTLGSDPDSLGDASAPGRDESDYGKILRLDRTTWEREVLSFGHRNPEGLLVVDGEIWSTEHGPYGGDELNLIEEGSDYGWPYASYGTDYGAKTLRLGSGPGDHEGFTRPIYAWTPSIGISNLVRAEGALFPLWEDDLLIASLSGLGNGESIFRVRLREGRVVSSERIHVGRRVRDLVQLPGGTLALWHGTGAFTIVRPADHVFSACASCHMVRNAGHAIGPDLYGVVGAEVARHENYAYSAAMRDFGGTWTPDRLDRFLENPSGVVPGTSMEHEGITDAATRAEIIKFLSEIRAGRPPN